MPIRRRLAVLTSISAFGGILFAPFVAAGLRSSGAPHVPSLSLLSALLFAGSGVVAGVCSWFGLSWADRAALPMPLLRAYEHRIRVPVGSLRRSLVSSLAAGVAVGLLITVVLHLLPIPANPGTLPVRLLTVFFAASVTEILVHLFVMSGLVLLFRRCWLAILLSSVVFVLVFHSGQVGTPAMTAAVVLANFTFGILTGWIYSRFGFESAMLTHAVAHVIALAYH
jgi:hypothetical protein